MTRLRRARPYASPGFLRSGSAAAPRYAYADKRSVTPQDRERAKQLAIPPAWTDVWIAQAPNSHILAVGVDAAGRRQYIYHPQWRERQDQRKFERARELAAAIPSARARVTRDLRRDGLPRERVLATAFRILDTAAVRIGNEEYATAHGSRGLVTLQRKHTRVQGNDVRFSFPAKSGRRARVTVEDVDLAAVIRQLAGGSPTARLLSWGENREPLTTADVNDYIRRITGGDFSAKDFRTLKGSVVAAEYLARVGAASTEREQNGAIREATRAAAQALGNTPAIALKSYIDPEILLRYRSGEVISLAHAPERALLDLLS